MIALALLLLASPDVDPARLAAQHFHAGEAAFAQGDFTAAALAFERAYGVAPRAAALLNAAEAWARAGERARAVRDCERALADPSIGDQERQEATRRIAALEPKIARIDAEGPEGYAIEIDGSGERVSLPAHAAVEPGSRSVVIFGPAGERKEQRVIDVPAGQARALVVAGAAPAALAPSPEVAIERTPGRGPPAPAWIGFGVAGASLVATVVLGAMTASAQSTYDAAPAQDAADAFYARRAGTNVALGVAIGSAAFALAFWWLAPEDGP